MNERIPRSGTTTPVEAAVQWASNMTWKGIKPIVHLVTTTYETGVKVLADALEPYKVFWQRSENLPKWDKLSCI